MTNQGFNHLKKEIQKSFEYFVKHLDDMYIEDMNITYDDVELSSIHSHNNQQLRFNLYQFEITKHTSNGSFGYSLDDIVIESDWNFLLTYQRDLLTFEVGNNPYWKGKRDGVQYDFTPYEDMPEDDLILHLVIEIENYFVYILQLAESIKKDINYAIKNNYYNKIKNNYYNK